MAYSRPTFLDAVFAWITPIGRADEYHFTVRELSRLMYSSVLEVGIVVLAGTPRIVAENVFC